MGKCSSQEVYTSLDTLRKNIQYTISDILAKKVGQNGSQGFIPTFFEKTLINALTDSIVKSRIAHRDSRPQEANSMGDVLRFPHE
jgi:hypothetical protein